MAGASDKARFFLEKTVPELREWERRELFTKQEISSIASKRSDFEHLLSARGAQPADYARYVEYEINLEALRRRRAYRKGVKNTSHSGQSRIFALLKRATKKFPGDTALWMQYIEYARKQKASRRVVRILTDLLRLHPTKPDLWIYAARYHFDAQADVSAARGYMQRGIRFCPSSSSLYLEYARLEMSHLAKIYARRDLLGINESKDILQQEQDEAKSAEDQTDADLISLSSKLDAPARTNEALSEQDNFASTPIMKGAIPLAVFSAAINRPDTDAAVVGHSFFNLFLEFSQLPFVFELLGTVTDHLIKEPGSYVEGLCCQCRLPLTGISLEDPHFPAALRSALAEIKSSMAAVPSQQPNLASAILGWLSPLAQEPSLLPELRRILQAREKQLAATAGGSPT